MRKYFVSSVILAVIVAALTFGLFWSTKYNEVYTQEYNDKGPCSCDGGIIPFSLDGSDVEFAPGSVEIKYVDENGDTITKKTSPRSLSSSDQLVDPDQVRIDCVSGRAAYAAWGFIFPAVAGAIFLLIVTVVVGIAASTRSEDFDPEEDDGEEDEV